MRSTVPRSSASIPGWSRICDWFDRFIWNGAVQIVSYLVLGVAWLDSFFDSYVVNTGFDGGCQTVSRSGQLTRPAPGRPNPDLSAHDRCRPRRAGDLPAVGSESMTTLPVLTILTALPVAGALILLLLGGRNKNLVRWTGPRLQPGRARLHTDPLVPLRPRIRRTPVPGALQLDHHPQRPVPRRHRRPRPADAAAHRHRRAHRQSPPPGRSKTASRSTSRSCCCSRPVSSAPSPR